MVDFYISMFDMIVKLKSVDGQYRDVLSWNAAIEKAAQRIERQSTSNYYIAKEIRKLKIDVD